MSDATIPLYSGATAGVQLLSRGGYLRSVVLTAAAAAATAKIYNNTSATGNPIASVAAGIGTSVYPTFNRMQFGGAGLFIVVTGAGADCIVEVE